MSGIDVPAEQKPGDSADKRSKSERPAIGDKAFAKRKKQRDLPDEMIARANPAIRQEQLHARNGGPVRTGDAARHHDIWRPEERQRRQQHHHGAQAERDAGPECDEGPTRCQGAHDADHRRNRLTHADLRSASLMVSERGEIGVVRGPVKSISERGNHAQREQRRTEAVDFGEQRILQRREAGAGNDQSARARRWHNDRPDDEPSGEDERERSQRPCD